MMSSYKDLLKQREELEKQIQEARQRELAEAVAKVAITTLKQVSMERFGTELCIRVKMDSQRSPV